MTGGSRANLSDPSPGHPSTAKIGGPPPHLAMGRKKLRLRLAGGLLPVPLFLLLCAEDPRAADDGGDSGRAEQFVAGAMLAAAAAAAGLGGGAEQRLQSEEAGGGDLERPDRRRSGARRVKGEAGAVERDGEGADGHVDG